MNIIVYKYNVSSVLFYLAIVLFSNYSFGQIDNNNSNKLDSMKKLNLDMYSDFNSDSKSFKHINNNLIYELFDNGSIYKEVITTEGELIKKIRLYDKDNLILMVEGTFFIDCPVGIFNKYDKEGKFKETIDYDKNYNFSIANLIEKLSLDFNIDPIRDEKELSITRSKDAKDEKYKYYIQWYLGNNSSRLITIDGNSGETIKDIITSNNY